MKILFFGTPEFAAKSLEALFLDENIKIVGVVTQTDKTVGRKQELVYSPVKNMALKLKLPLMQPANKKELEKMIELINVDFFVVIAFGMILTEKTLTFPKIASINVHGSILPKYRGASPIQEALLHGDSETGISIIKMDAKLDHGPVFKNISTQIDEDDDYNSLSDKLSILAAKQLPKTLNDIFEGKSKAVFQDDNKATYCKKIQKMDGIIDWKLSAEDIINKIKAYSEWPNCYTKFNGKNLKILKALKEDGQISPGMAFVQNNELKIGTGKGIIKPKILQMEGKKEVNEVEFLNGYKSKINQYQF